MLLLQEISNRATQFQDLCKAHKVQKLYGFGSAITHDFDASKSDIDLLVSIDETDPLKRGNHLLALWDEFEDFFNRRVDLLTENSLKNPFLKKSIEATKVLIYDRQST
jgi:predicted nucleotidyltransferase